MAIKDKLDMSKSLIKDNDLSDPNGVAFTLGFEGTNRVINITNEEILELTINAINDKKITELEPITGTELDGTDVLAIVDVSEDETKKITTDELYVSFLRGGIAELTIGDLHIIDNRIENFTGGIVLQPEFGFSVEISSVDITGGSITGTTIGGAGVLASDGTFNNLTILPNGILSVASIDNVNINPTTPAPGQFTTLGLTSNLSAPNSNAEFLTIDALTIDVSERITSVFFVTDTGRFDGDLGTLGAANHPAYVTNLDATGVATLQTANVINLFIDNTQVLSTADELNLLDGSISGSVVDGKAVIYSGNGNVNATTLSVGLLDDLSISENQISTTVGDLSISPAGDLILNPTGQILLQSDTVLTSGTFQAQNFFADNSMRTAGAFYLGTNSNPPINYLEIKLESQNPIIQNPNGSGNIKIQTHELFIESEDGTQELATFTDGGQVKLNFDGTTRIETTSSGALLTGNVVVTSEGSNAGSFQAAGGIIVTQVGGTESESRNVSAIDLNVYGNTKLGDSSTDTVSISGPASFAELVTLNNGMNLPEGCITWGPSGDRRLSVCYTDSGGARDSVSVSLSQPSSEALKAPLVVSTDTLSVITNSGVTADLSKFTYDRASIYQQGRELIFTRTENIPGEGTVDTVQVNGNFETTGDINTQHVDMEDGFLSRGRSQIEGHDLEIEEASARIQLIDNTVVTDLKIAYISNAVDGEVVEVGTSLTFEANGAKTAGFVPGAGRIKFKTGGVPILDFDYIRPSSPLVESDYTQIRNRNSDEDIVINPNRNMVLSTPNLIQLDNDPVLSLVDAADPQTVLSTSIRSTWTGEDGNIVLNSDPSGLVDSSNFALQLGGDEFLRMTEGTNSGADASEITLSIHGQEYFQIERRQSGVELSTIALSTDFTNKNQIIMTARSQNTAAVIDINASTDDYLFLQEGLGAEEGRAFFSTHVEIPDMKELRFGTDKDVHFEYDDATNMLNLHLNFEKKFAISGLPSSTSTTYQPAATFQGGEYQQFYGKSTSGGTTSVDIKLATSDSGVTISGRALIEEYGLTSIKPSVALSENGTPDIKSVLTQDDYTFRIQTEDGANIVDRFAIYQQDKSDLGYTAGIKEFKNGDTHFLADGNEYRMIWDESAGRLGVGMRWNPTATPPFLENPAAKIHIQESVNGIASGLRIDNSSSGSNRLTTGVTFKLGNISNNDVNTPKSAIYFRGKEIIGDRGFGRGDIHFALNDVLSNEEVSINDIKVTILDNGHLGVGTLEPDAKIEIRGSGVGQGLRIYNDGLPGNDDAFIDLENDNTKFTFLHNANGPLSITETDYLGPHQRFFLESGNILLNVAQVSDSVFTATGSRGNIQILGESLNNDISNVHILSEIISPAAVRRVMTFETNHTASTVGPKRVSGHIRTGIYDATDADASPPLIIGTDKLIIQSEDGTSEFASFDENGFEVRRVIMDDGTVGEPSLTFQSDLDTGIYRIGTNSIGVTTGGTKRLEIDSDGFAHFSLGVGSSISLSSIEANKAAISQFSTADGYRNLQMRASTHEFLTGVEGGTTLETAFIINADQKSQFSNSTSVINNQAGATTLDVFNSTTDAAASARIRVGLDYNSCLDIYRVGDSEDIHFDATEITADIILNTGGSQTFSLLSNGNAVLNNAGEAAVLNFGGITGNDRMFLGRDGNGNGFLTNVSNGSLTFSTGGTAVNTAFIINADQTSLFLNSTSVVNNQAGATTFDVFNNTVDAAASARLRVGLDSSSCLDIYRAGGSEDINIDATESTADIIFNTGGSETFRLDSFGNAILDNPNGPTILNFGSIAGSDRMFLARDEVGNGYLSNVSNGSLRISTAGTDRLYVGADGLIGINTTGPDTLLHLVGDTVGGNNAKIRIQHHETIPNFLDISSENNSGLINYSGNGTDGLDIKTQGTKPLKLFTNDINRVFIDGTDGKIGFYSPGASTQPLSLLHGCINGAGAIPTDSFVQTEDDNVGLTLANFNLTSQYTAIRFQTRPAQTSGWLIGNNHQSDYNGDFFFRARDEAATSREVLRLKSDGNVGIGVTDPSDKLVIRGNAGESADLNIQSAAAGNPARLLLGDQTNPTTGVISYTQQSKDMTFSTDSTVRATISGAGQTTLAVGLTTPSITLNGETRTSWPNPEYEEAAFTPVITTQGSEFGYTIQYGYYIRIGNIVHIYSQITINQIFSQGIPIVAVTLGGLPFDMREESDEIVNRLNVFTSNVLYPVETAALTTFTSTPTDLGILAQSNNAGWNVMNVNEWRWASGSSINVFGSYVTS